MIHPMETLEGVENQNVRSQLRGGRATLLLVRAPRLLIGEMGLDL
jgi:hypothetical protein